MNTRTAGIRVSLTLLASAVLAACAVQPTKPLPTPAVVTPLPQVPAPAVASKPKAAAAAQPWAGIVATDVMHDCADAPLIRANARMYTRSPAHFERLLQQSLPLIIYVHGQLQANGIPGEFTMLPMLESSYRAAEPSRHGDAGGMWQFMPHTARRHGIVVNRHYDGRLDPVASTKAAIAMLKSLDQRFGDWRLVDMAYNAGPYAITGALREHPQLGSGAIPDLPVSHASRTHLARLMALSCILRDPSRYNVKLPQPTAGDELAAIEVPAGSRLSHVANLAEISEATLRRLNPGYHGTRVPPDSPRKLLLPIGAAQALVAALTVDTSESVAQVSTREPNAGASDAIPLPAEPTPPATDNSAPTPMPKSLKRHRVREGETLWSIAREFDVSVRDLKHWNHLHDDTVRIGEELRVQG